MPLSPQLSDHDYRTAARPFELVSPDNVAKPPALLAARVLQFQATVLSHDTFTEAAAAFATEVASMLHFDRAAIGFIRRGSASIVAISHSADFQPNGELFSAFSAAMDEALDQRRTVAFPELPETPPLITLAHAELGRRYGGSACSIPLVSRGRAFGALSFVRAGTIAVRQEEVALCEHLACIVGPILELKWQGARPWHGRLLDDIRAGARKIIEPGNTGAKACASLVAAAVFGALFVPVQYRVGAPARIEGSIQRALVAPSDGFLRQAYARPGDRVKAGGVVAELAGEDLQLERRKWESELTQHENAASAALARADRAQFVINQSKADEARAALDLVETQLVRARIVAPFDGIVIKGDLSQSLGAPLRRGEVLVTIAPEEKFRLLVDVDERDISVVRAGQRGSVALGAISDRALPFRVAKITPVASTREGRNFFEVEGELEAPPSILRPGLLGVAKIDIDERTLAWIWTHRLIDWIRLMLWSWGV